MRPALIRSGVSALAFGVLACTDASGQPAASTPTFEVTSVKLDSPDAPRIGTQGGPGSRDPERFTGKGMPLRLYLCLAYAKADCQEQISGPKWIDSEKYDIDVKIPPGTSKELYQKMFQSLLTERFQLVVRHETKVQPVYELVVAKDGPKLKESVPTSPADPPAADTPGKVEVDSDGFPVLPPGVPGFTNKFGPGVLSRWTAQRQTMSALAARLSSQSGRGPPGDRQDWLDWKVRLPSRL